MARSMNDIIAALPVDEQEAIEARYQELKQEVESLRELRQIAGKAQEDIATALNIKQPSVSKIEKQADMYLSTLRSYVEAVGGKLELTVKLPSHPALRLHSLGDVTVETGNPARSVARRRKQTTAR
ncbi:XRE family transcriptional regulator [Brucella oryzae]|nr:XRE family transcriptional regulator [Brucella oryzae]MBR7654688.1 XRE family transcriptional regulator [Brucella oryzae]